MQSGSCCTSCCSDPAVTARQVLPGLVAHNETQQHFTGIRRRPAGCSAVEVMPVVVACLVKSWNSDGSIGRPSGGVLEKSQQKSKESLYR